MTCAEQPQISSNLRRRSFTRRRFLSSTAAGGAAWLAGGLTLLNERAAARTSFSFVEATIPQLQAAMAAGQLTARELVHGYLDRIQQLNPILHAVIETNPNAHILRVPRPGTRSRGYSIPT